ncbi:AAA family ATPase [Photobacterium damselae]|uniref:AAA family ATPase n=1 Tax=Photobacterium damselae TaxID=38293 RepID=UPI004067B0B3
MFLELTVSNYKNHELAQLGTYARQKDRIDQTFISKFISGVDTVKFTGIYGFNNKDTTDLLKVFVLIADFTTSKKRVFNKPTTSKMFTKNLLAELHGNDTNKPTFVSMHFFLDNQIFEYTLEVQDGKVIAEKVTTDSFTHQNEEPKLLLSRQLLPNSSYEVIVNDDNDKKRFVVPFSGAWESIVSAFAPSHHAAKLIFDYMNGKFTTNLDNIDNEVSDACSVYCNNPTVLDDAQETLRALDLLPINSEVIITHDDITGYTVEVYYKNDRIDGKAIVFTFDEQSSGFRYMFCLLSKIMPVVNNGGLCVINHLDEHLHCLVAEALVSIFNAKKCHAQAQCLATFKSTRLLKKLKHDQVYFVDAADGKLSVKSAEQFCIRSDADLEDMLYRNQLIKLPSLKLS